MSLVSYTFFKNRPTVGEFQLFPLTGGRLIILEERGNPLALEDVSESEVDPFALYEALLVASCDGETLAEVSLCNDLDWKLEVRKFGLDCSDEAINDFEQVIKKEMEAIQKAAVKSAKKKAARKVGKPGRRGK